MDEKKVREAIAKEKETIKTLEDAVVSGKTGSLRRWAKDTIENSTIIIEALEKQLPKKPKEYEDKYYACPVCGNILMYKWEDYPTKLRDKKEGLPCCLCCLQRLDWTEE